MKQERHLNLQTRSVTLLRVVIVAISSVPTIIYLVVALRRIGYPFELEWLEGGAVEIVRRVAGGHSMYVQPSLHYVPYPYTPLYFWVSGALAHVTGVGFLPLRLVSLVSSLGCCVMLLKIVWRETGDPVAGVLATGLFTATFAVSGAWLDIGRVDSFALFLLLVALYVARQARDVNGGLLVGTLIFVAFMAKQNVLLAAAPVVLLLMITRRRVGITALVTTAALVVGSTLVLNASTDNWYGYYVFSELTHQGTVSSVWRTFFTKDLWHTPWSIGLGLGGLLVTLRYRAAATTDWLFWAVAIGGLLGSAFVSRLHSGGGRDVLIPAFAAVALLGAFGYDALRRQAGHVASTSPTRIASATPVLVGAALVSVIAVQLGALHYSPSRYVPSASDESAGNAFIAAVRRTPGPVIVVNHPYYETLAGKVSWAQGEAMHDVMRAGPSRARRDLAASITSFLNSSQSVTIYSDYSTFALGSYSDPYFRLTPTRVFDCRHCFYPVTDLKLRPAFRFVRR